MHSALSQPRQPAFASPSHPAPPSRACQLLAPSTSAFSDLADPRATLRSAGIQHGSLVYLRYTVERRVTPTPGVETRPFGAPRRPPLCACAAC